MGWTDQIDAYCERLGPGLWAEPLNAVSNMAFLIAALVMWRRTGGRGMGGLLSALLALIGICSGLWHTLAQGWTGAADSGSILIFVLVYLFAANRRFLGVGPWMALGATVLAVPFMVLLGAGFARIPWLGSSAGYLPLPVLIFGYAAALYRRVPETAWGLALGAGLLMISLAFRTLDTAVCDFLPAGTHVMWHVLNAIMLAWMIEVWLRAKSGASQTGIHGAAGDGTCKSAS